MEEILNVCKMLAVKSGDKIMEIYNTDFEVFEKDNKSPLTLADTCANDIIVSALKKKYPDYKILSEESIDDLDRLTSDYCFVIDPLDGTKEFINKNGEFTVNIALTYKGKSILGVIYAPVLNDLYYAFEGNGAYIENSTSNLIKRIFVTDKENDLTAVMSKSHCTENEKILLENNKLKIKKTVSKGSSLKGCMVATGEADVYYRFGLTSVWDTCAMQCIVEEAGGIFRQLDNSKLLYNKKETLNKKGFFVVNNEKNIWI